MLCNQPPEIVDAIISEIEHPLDLLHLALTRKLFKNLIIPWHIQYRVIIAHLFYPSIWELLASRPDVASRVHKLDVVTRRRRNSPPVSVNSLLKDGHSLLQMELSKEQESKEQVANCLVNFHVALSLMVNLHRFSIETYNPNFGWPLGFTDKLNCVAPRHIREMSLHNTIYGLHWYDEYSKVGLHVRNSQMGITFKLGGFDFDQNLLKLLHHNPRLRDLRIELGHSHRLVATLREVHLPELLRFTLGGAPDQLYDYESIVDMSTFFSRHNGLESLHLHRMRVAPGVFHPDMLLGLKYLKLGGFPLRVESGVLPTGFGKQLRHLNITLDLGCVPLLSHMTGLVVMDVTTKYIIPWAAMRVLPKLQILRWRSHLKLDNDDIEKLVDHLSIFPDLRCLHMIGYVKRSNARAILEKATMILPLLEDLRLKFANDENLNQVFEIKRIPDGDTYEYILTMLKDTQRLHYGDDYDAVLSSGGRDFSGDFYTGELKLNVSQI
ncbi:hypothetical protein BU17DRAFT_66919 [Hysterangium stoloniferum]|nr:hypothetical protein BU17DRAFT_66919 [Hysterangium stoloniferum]